MIFHTTVFTLPSHYCF